ncbi:MAG TPA: ROK family protein [Prolixibacteraceae bacterium]|nr:ROK family protein [Prolixibacteraceae bacterium]
MHTAKSKIIGVDMGGTNIRAGLIENGVLGQIVKTATPSDSSGEEVIETLVELVAALDPTSAEAIGIGVPTIVDIERGIVYNATNIKNWKEVPLKQILENRLGIPVFVNNDANCFAAGEKYFGKAKGYSSVVGLVLGTGLGTGLILNDRLYEGKNCGAGEMCNLPYLNRNYEYYSCGQFFKDELKTTAHEVYDQAVSGDPMALKYFETFGFHLGKFIQAILYAYDPQLIVFGGSVTQAFPFFSPAMYCSMEEGFIFPNSLKNLKIEISELENVAIYGAASLVFEKVK